MAQIKLTGTALNGDEKTLVVDSAARLYDQNGNQTVDPALLNIGDVARPTRDHADQIVLTSLPTTV